MSENATREQEPDASNANQRPTSEADSETVHSAGNWRLVVRADGSVEAIESDGGRRWTTADDDYAPPRASYRYGETIEETLARYTHETHFDRDPNEGEYDAALRDGIIDALQSLASVATCRKCQSRATHVEQVNAPGNARTRLLCREHVEHGRYVIFYALDSATEAGQ
jgi:hypothetical protein